jgi:hypothetical protein
MGKRKRSGGLVKILRVFERNDNTWLSKKEIRALAGLGPDVEIPSRIRELRNKYSLNIICQRVFGIYCYRYVPEGQESLLP